MAGTFDEKGLQGSVPITTDACPHREFAMPVLGSRVADKNFVQISVALPKIEKCEVTGWTRTEYNIYLIRELGVTE